MPPAAPCARADACDRRPPPPDGAQANDDRKLFVGNLAWAVDGLDLEDIFKEFGTVESAQARAAPPPRGVRSPSRGARTPPLRRALVRAARAPRACQLPTKPRSRQP
jgi:RNA recognition motif-containing protein